jgi:hypothetical protein
VVQPGREGRLDRRHQGRTQGRHHQLVLYRLPELLAAPPSEPVCIVEGDKDVGAKVAGHARRVRILEIPAPHWALLALPGQCWAGSAGNSET